jgi:RimJ/RimL family protein N-acetyltransferase
MNVLSAGPVPERVVLEGCYCRLEPLSESHSDAFYEAVAGPEVAARFRYLLSHPPEDSAAHRKWVVAAATHAEWLYSAVIDRATGKCGGCHALMRVRPEHRSVEIGSILWGEGIAKTRLATEAFFLTASYVFDTLGYRRFEWKCNNANLPSKRSAVRFGFIFEGVFRQDMIVKGENRDTAWFSILDGEWPALKEKFEAWLDPDNFDEAGREKAALTTPRLRAE